MRVLTFLHSFALGGVERDALRLNAGWRDAGIDVRVVVGRRIGVLRAEAPDLDYHFLTGPRASWTRHFESLFMIARLPAEIRRFRPDILFCAGNTYTVVAVAMQLLLGRACPPIVLKISNDLERRDLPGWRRAGYHLWLRLQAPSFAAIVAMASPARAEIERCMRVVPERVVVIENASLTAVEAERLAAARAAQPRTHIGRRFLGIGRLVPQKNFALLIRAFASIAGPDDKLTIVGEGRERQRLERLAESLGLAAQVELPGHRQPLDAFFADADLFILSSDYEGLGVVVVEALAAGVPVVATDCCVNMPALVEGVGQLVAPGDLRALAKAMDRPLAAPDPEQMRDRVVPFTVEASVGQWRALFARLARHAFYLP